MPAIERGRIHGAPVRKKRGGVARAIHYIITTPGLSSRRSARVTVYRSACGIRQRLNRGKPREPNEVRARNRLQMLLGEQLAPDELERLRAEGAQMTEEDSCRIAVEQ